MNESKTKRKWNWMQQIMNFWWWFLRCCGSIFWNYYGKKDFWKLKSFLYGREKWWTFFYDTIGREWIENWMKREWFKRIASSTEYLLSNHLVLFHHRVIHFTCYCFFYVIRFYFWPFAIEFGIPANCFCYSISELQFFRFNSLNYAQ